MIKQMFLPMAAIVAMHATAGEISEADMLRSGRRMVVLDVPSDSLLSGTAPAEAGKTFRILNGIDVLW